MCLRKILCAALAAMMILMGTSCNVLTSPESFDDVVTKAPTSENTLHGGSSGVGGGNRPAETAPSESEKETITHVHVDTVLDAVAPTCTEPGLTEGVLCGECGEIMVEQEVIPAAGHTPGADATCTESQNCTVCGEIMNSANGHIPSAPATCTTAQTCTVCHIELAPALGHTEVIDSAVAATCTKSGKTEGKHCSACGIVFVKQNSLPAKGHTLGNWVVDKQPALGVEGNKYRYCTVCGGARQNEVIEMLYSQGLEYGLLDDGTYEVSGMGTCTNTIVAIPHVYEGNAVTKIGNRAFYHCKTMTSVIIPDSVTSIGEDAFDWCENLTSVIIPDSVTSIGDRAFYACLSLTDLTIPNSVTSIGAVAFRDCDSLTSITIPGSLTSTGQQAFYWCDRLTSVTIGDGVTNIGYGAFSMCSSLTDVVIPDSVTSIGDYAFSSCSGLTSIVIPDGVTSIGDYAFSSCSGLTSITIPAGVTNIGSGAFAGCTNLTDFRVHNGNQSYVVSGDILYNRDMTTLISYFGSKTYVYIPYGVTSIAAGAFYGCSGLTSITIPDSVTSIGKYAFYGCSGLTSIVIPNSVISIGEYSFYNCSNLTSIVIPDSVTSIDDSAFEGCDNLIVVEDGVYYVDKWVVYCDQSVHDVVLREDTVGIGNSAFSDCSSLTSIVIPDSVTSIGNSAFERCISLTSIVIPDSMTSIGNYAFSSCGWLTDIYFTGTESEWNAIDKGFAWDYETGSYTLHFNYVP